jgi:hypothetical protein
MGLLLIKPVEMLLFYTGAHTKRNSGVLGAIKHLSDLQIQRDKLF